MRQRANDNGKLLWTREPAVKWRQRFSRYLAATLAAVMAGIGVNGGVEGRTLRGVKAGIGRPRERRGCGFMSGPRRMSSNRALATFHDRRRRFCVRDGRADRWSRGRPSFSGCACRGAANVTWDLGRKRNTGKTGPPEGNRSTLRSLRFLQSAARVRQAAPRIGHACPLGERSSNLAPPAEAGASRLVQKVAAHASGTKRAPEKRMANSRGTPSGGAGQEAGLARHWRQR